MSVLEQVFLYVTKRCNAQCARCYADPVSASVRGADSSFDGAAEIIRRYRSRGAFKLTFLGGEPTLHARLPELARRAKQFGYQVVRINTNGMWPRAFQAESENLRVLDIISFSIDGPTAAINDRIRAGCELDVTLANMRRAVKMGCDVRVNSTIRQETVQHIDRLVMLAQDNGARKIYLNLELDRAGDRGVVSVDPRQWGHVRSRLLRMADRFSIEIEIAAGFATDEELSDHETLGHRCLAADGKRKYVNEKGQVWPCLLFLNDPAWSETVDGAKALHERAGVPAASLHRYCHFLGSIDSRFRPLCIYHRFGLNVSQTLGHAVSQPDVVAAER